MTPVIRAACSPGEIRVAYCEGSRLLDYAVWRPGAPDGVGDLYRGRVVARVPAMAGAFVAIGGAEGFLPDSAGGAALSAGEHRGVRIVRAAQGGKGPRLTARLSDAEREHCGEGAVGLRRRGPGAVERLAGHHQQAAVLVDDPGIAALLAPVLPRPAEIVVAAFDEAIESEAAALGEPAAPLPGGGVLHVHPTPALTALDVDLGARSAERRGKARAQEEANAAFIPEIARQIRLRALGGAILVDFGGMHARRRAALGPALARALADDPGGPRLLGFTALGLAEILRPRVHPPLHEVLAGPHAAGLAGLREAERRVRAAPGHAATLHASPAIVAALEADAFARDAFARRTGHRIGLVADPALARNGEAWSIR